MTRTGPSPGAVRADAADAARARAVNPARPMMAALAATERVGQRHDPFGGHPCVGGESAVARHAEVVSLHQHAFARREVVAGALARRCPSSSTPGTSGKRAGHPVARSCDHGVLVVDGGPLDVDQDVARREVVLGQLDDGATDDRTLLREQVGGKAVLSFGRRSIDPSGCARSNRVRSDGGHEGIVRALALSVGRGRCGAGEGVALGALLGRRIALLARIATRRIRPRGPGAPWPARPKRPLSGHREHPQSGPRVRRGSRVPGARELTGHLRLRRSGRPGRVVLRWRRAPCAPQRARAAGRGAPPRRSLGHGRRSMGARGARDPPGGCTTTGALRRRPFDAGRPATRGHRAPGPRILRRSES